MRSVFLFTTCQIGAEGALKEEIARDYPFLRFSFSKPGFLTFKSVEKELEMDFKLISVFARSYGLSLEKLDARLPTEDEKIAQIFSSLEKIHPASEATPLHLHVWEKDQYQAGQEPLGFDAFAQSNLIRKKILSLDSKKVFSRAASPQKGEAVLDVVILDETLWWLGCHLHSAFHTPYAGGIPHLELPSDAPSRAYLKLEESVLWSELQLKTGDMAVEIGSAPGGASFALLNKGLSVVGIDPGQMDARVLRSSNFKHLQCPVGTVLREDLPPSVQWLFLDMNVAPQNSLFEVDRLVSRLKDSLLGVVLTVKLNQWKTAKEIPYMLEHLRSMGIAKARAKQLFHNRQEFCAVGLTRMGSLRR